MTSPIYLLLTPDDRAGDRAEYERLADELRHHARGAVELRDDAPTSDAPGAFIVTFGGEPPAWALALPEPARQETLRRVVVIGCGRPPSSLRDLEAWNVAAGVDNLLYGSWLQGTRPSGFGIAGLRTVVERIGGKCVSASFCTERYCVYGSASSTTLPQALAEYLSGLATE